MWALVALIAVGVILREAMFLAQSPGLFGISDTAHYVAAAKVGIYLLAVNGDNPYLITDPNPWPAGYPLFLRTLHGIDANLWSTIFVQHLLGILTAVLAFLTVRRVAPAAWGLIPAGIVLLAGPQIFLEHNPMPETLFTFLIAGLTYSAIRARYDDRPVPWSLLAGFCAAALACVRIMGLAYIALVLAWMLVGTRRGLKHRAIATAAAGLMACLVLGAYLVEMKRETGYGGPTLTRSGNYGAPARSGDGGSYIKRVANDATRFWASDDGHPASKPYTVKELSSTGYDYDGMTQLMDTPSLNSVKAISALYPTVAKVSTDDGLVDAMRSYEKRSRLEGPLFMLLLLLALAGIPLARGPRLAAGILLLLVTAVTLIVPIAYVYFDARYAVPGYGPLGMAGAIGAATLWERLAPELSGWLRVPRHKVAVGTEQG